MHAPKISVIVPLFKTEKYIEKCLRSIMSQTFTDFEILCVDDCSPDGSVAIVERLAKEDPRIVLIRHSQNLGLGGARNTAIRAARADYIASVDSDDYIEEGMLAALWEGTNDGYYDVVVCGYARVDEAGKILSRHHTQKKTIDPISNAQSPFNVSNPAFWNKLWRRSLYVENDIFFPNHIYYQDSATTPRIYSVSKNVNFVGGLYYNYLVRGDSVTNSRSDKHIMDKFRQIDIIVEFFKKNDIYNKYSSNINKYIFGTYSYHAENVHINNDGGDDETDRYLRHMLLMRDAYLALDDTVRRLSLAEKVAALKAHQTLDRSSASEQPRAVAPAPLKSSSLSARSPLPARPRVLVLTMFSGENEFEESCASLASQAYDNWDHVVFEGLGNVEAHEKLYGTIMSGGDSYDLFLKLDADMVFENRNILEEIIGKFRIDDTLDHFVVACDCYMTDNRIIGVHAFSNRVKWERNSGGIFLDPNPSRPGRRIMLKNPPFSFFRHSPNPSPFQAFHFGAHRALKLVQRNYGVAEKRVEAMDTQWKALNGVWRQFCKHGDRRHALALAAADLIINDELGGDAHNYRDPALMAAYEKYAICTSEKLRRILLSNWGDEVSRERYFNKAVGPAGLEKLALHENEQSAKKKDKNKVLSA